MAVVQELTVRDAARRTRKSEETIRRWIWSGRLPATKQGNSYRIDINHLERVAVVFDDTETGGGHSSRTSAHNDLAAWLAEVDSWKASLGGLPRTGASSADLVIEDRRARR